jgi:hypothetical protein
MKMTRNASFQYTPSFKTDLRKTFARVRRQQLEKSLKAAPTPAAPVNIASLTRKSAGNRN